MPQCVQCAALSPRRGFLKYRAKGRRLEEELRVYFARERTRRLTPAARVTVTRNAVRDEAVRATDRCLGRAPDRELWIDAWMLADGSINAWMLGGGERAYVCCTPVGDLIRWQMGLSPHVAGPWDITYNFF